MENKACKAFLAPSTSNISISSVMSQGTQAGAAMAPANPTITMESGKGNTTNRAEQRKGRSRKNSVDLSSGPVISSQPPSTSPPSGDIVKRVRGRPKGSPRPQLLPSSGACAAAAIGGTNFVPHVIIVYPGEDVAQKLFSFLHWSSSAVVILSCTGTIATVDVRQFGQSRDVERFEGHFEIISLSGSATSSTVDSTSSKDTVFAISLAKSNGQVFGGAVMGALVAGGAVQIIAGTFEQNTNQEPQKRNSAKSSTPIGMEGNVDLKSTPPTSEPMKLVEVDLTFVKSILDQDKCQTSEPLMSREFERNF